MTCERLKKLINLKITIPCVRSNEHHLKTFFSIERKTLLDKQSVGKETWKEHYLEKGKEIKSQKKKMKKEKVKSFKRWYSVCLSDASSRSLCFLQGTFFFPLLLKRVLLWDFSAKSFEKFSGKAMQATFFTFSLYYPILYFSGSCCH